MLPWNGSWEDHLALVEFAYSNSYHASIKMNHMNLCMDRNVILYCVGKFLASACWSVHNGYNVIMVRNIRSDRIY
jgi:hypothetical protein